ncbi:MAG: SAM-dependent methyltransferase [Chloroflexota bacterium]|nr:SAM-dependent methyltransferase [Chloroflexota bacterium]
MPATPLQRIIVERIQQAGPLSFADYMRMALYEPGGGYYVTGAAKMGWEGDYYTSPDIGPIFAHCLGRQLYTMWGELGRPRPFVVLEQGAGRGNLAHMVREWAAQERPDLHEALDYAIQDIHAGQDVIGTPDSSRGQTKPAVILSNELIDAFPVHIVEKRGRQLYEVYVDLREGQLCEVLGEPGSPEVASYLDAYQVPWRTFDDGWRAEINLDALRWLQRATGLLERGFILTIDYGDKARRLYTPQRPRGTLACYFRHQMNERPLTRPGQQDITAHVNFSALLAEGRRQGLHLHTFSTQRLWLERMGINEEIEYRRTHEFAAAETERASDRGQVALLRWYNLRQRVLALTDPAGMGNFQVLILKRV